MFVSEFCNLFDDEAHLYKLIVGTIIVLSPQKNGQTWLKINNFFLPLIAFLKYIVMTICHCNLVDKQGWQLIFFSVDRLTGKVSMSNCMNTEQTIR